MTFLCPECGAKLKVAGFYFSHSTVSGEAQNALTCYKCDHKWEPKEGEQVGDEGVSTPDSK